MAYTNFVTHTHSVQKLFVILLLEYNVRWSVPEEGSEKWWRGQLNSNRRVSMGQKSEFMNATTVTFKK